MFQISDKHGEVKGAGRARLDRARFPLCIVRYDCDSLPSAFCKEGFFSPLFSFFFLSRIKGGKHCQALFAQYRLLSMQRYPFGMEKPEEFSTLSLGLGQKK